MLKPRAFFKALSEKSDLRLISYAGMNEQVGQSDFTGKFLLYSVRKRRTALCQSLQALAWEQVVGAWLLLQRS